MEHAPATLVDVAAAAGVSVATASRAINAHPHVSPHTRARVLEAAERLRFQPSPAARALRTRRANVIGLIVPDISSVFFATALRAAEHTLRRQGYTLFITDTEQDEGLEVEAIKALLSHRVAGVILAPVAGSATPLRRALSRYAAPLVTIDNRVQGLDADAVLMDNVEGTRVLTAHLIGHGHRRVGYIGGLLRETSGAERLAGYTQALQDAGLPFDPLLAREGDWSREAGQRMMDVLLELPEPPTAVVVASHTMVVGALLVLRARGRRVPVDMALVSFDDTPSWPVMDPPITALESNDYELGRLAAELLLARLRGQGTAGRSVVRLSAPLVLRRSCGCP